MTPPREGGDPEKWCWTCGTVEPPHRHHEPVSVGPDTADRWLCVSCGHYDWRQEFQDIGDPSSMPRCPGCGGADLATVGTDPYGEDD